MTTTPRTRGPRGPYAKTRATKLRILDAALAVFAESGFRSGSLREVADKVGLSDAGLLHHYPNKAALLEAVLRHRDDVALVDFHVDLADPRAVVQAFVDITERNMHQPGVVELYCTLSAEATTPDHPAHGYFIERYDWLRGLLTQAFTGLAERGELRDGVDPASAAVQLVSLLDGLQVQWLLDRTALDMTAEVKRHVDTLVHAPFVDPRAA
ncbi:TetR/AcrR family transcriptional regulator [Demequina sp. SYSU T00039]|uniref:TetR/AcrR family transcriptional regulator n=1 Tax=Demequina lignilytica TaxID=3051663 RepID=A0AAW7M576_9MICO|nr:MULTISPECIES: TetR/AcrR family transcriptional regulator [unclassified Demequina]MDN4478768.1 TetR/AcrR family transcriptional regulator [Demequina sp. SYSU T00039-1]MDN4489192.1 TetR/AcrR family transcriptional regulator [Demequina sp. SYSU T00039]MDN4491642.1 TetR/AcrR family transcriptional regulator [Demequina sp. SYSU T00068]